MDRVRGSDLEEGESQGLPVWSRHVGDPILSSNLTRRVDFALFMVEALDNDELIHEAPATSAGKRRRRSRMPVNELCAAALLSAATSGCSRTLRQHQPDPASAFA